MSIQVENVSFSYTGKPVLNNLSFELASGEFAALLGPNGAGKSTIFALLSRLYSLQQGEIQLQGKPLSSSPASVMQHLGVVFQQSALDLDLTVRQNLSYHAALHGYSNKQANQRIHYELERMQMFERADEKVRVLNGGHRRRVEIARALLHQPNVLLLDEPTTGLDPESRLSLNTYVRELCAERELTALWATHLIEEIKPEDRVLLLHQGHLLSTGTGQDLCDLSQQDTLTESFKQLTKAKKEAAV